MQKEAAAVCAQSCQTLVTLGTVGRQAPLSWDFPGKNTAVGCHFLLQGIFPAQGSKPCLLHLPTLAGEFFTTSTTWKVHILSPGREAALAWASLAQRSSASSVLAREGAGCGSVGDVPGAWLASAPLWPSLWT